MDFRVNLLAQYDVRYDALIRVVGKDDFILLAGSAHDEQGFYDWLIAFTLGKGNILVDRISRRGQALDRTRETRSRRGRSCTGARA